MTRLITKQMRDSFNLRVFTKHFAEHGMKLRGCKTKEFSRLCKTDKEKQRILILKGTIK